ncbi:MAG: DNA polymerase IV [Candidatus Omnitrophica bacterium]|nr:DNA polymerase IV [Candidatus Omnitrophota bacterium]
MILHVDMDAFFASIEQAINPRLKGKPLIVGSRQSRFHTVVCAASYEAKRLGIGSGMSSQEAFSLCPGLEFVPADQSKYIWTSEEIFKLLQDYGFPLNYASIDEFQLDIGDVPEPQKIALDIQQAIQRNFNITASIGIAKNWLLSKLASKLNKPNGIAMITDDNLETVLAAVPVRKLCGVGASTEVVLQCLGIKTCLDLYRQSGQFLHEHLGQHGLDFYASLRATDKIELQDQAEKPKSVGHSYTFPRASQNTGFIHAWIRLLSEMVALRLREKNLVARTVHLWLNGPQIGNFSAQKTYAESTDDGQIIYQKTLKILARSGPKTPKIRAMGVTCSGLVEQAYQPLFLEQKRREALVKSLDQINTRFGEDTIYPAVITLTRKLI